MNRKEFLDLVSKKLGCEYFLDDHSAEFIVDKGEEIERTDGNYQTSLSEFEDQEISDKYKEKNREKMSLVSELMEEENFGGTVHWEYAKNGDCKIVIYN